MVWKWVTAGGGEHGRWRHGWSRRRQNGTWWQPRLAAASPPCVHLPRVGPSTFRWLGWHAGETSARRPARPGPALRRRSCTGRGRRRASTPRSPSGPRGCRRGSPRQGGHFRGGGGGCRWTGREAAVQASDQFSKDCDRLIQLGGCQKWLDKNKLYWVIWACTPQGEKAGRKSH